MSRWMCAYLVAVRCLVATSTNLEGPFVFWGPPALGAYSSRAALDPLEQDELVDIYSGRDAIAVFNVQDSAYRLSYPNYPRLGKLLQGLDKLVAPQDFLDVHPDYINNETHIITVQGPFSEQDAEITEKFQRLEDIYGKGNVLAILATSTASGDFPIDEDSDVNLLRSRRQATEDVPKEAAEEVVYNVPGKVLMYTADFPVLKYAFENNTSGDVIKLKMPISSSWDVRGQYSRLVISFTTPFGRFTLRIRFPEYAGYWNIDSIELLDPLAKEALLLNPPVSDVFLGAPRGFSFMCGSTFVFSNGSTSITFNEIQVQPLLDGATKFGPAYNCVNFTTIPIWSGLLVTAILLVGVTIAIYMILEIKVMDRFENSKGKTLTINVTD